MADHVAFLAWTVEAIVNDMSKSRLPHGRHRAPQHLVELWRFGLWWRDQLYAPDGILEGRPSAVGRRCAAKVNAGHRHRAEEVELEFEP